MTTTVDNRTCDAVMHELEWDPQVDSSRLAVTAHDGAIVLSGSVSSVLQRLSAVRAAERVRGVRAVADEIDVKLRDFDKRSDAELAKSVAQHMKWHSSIPTSVTAEVLNGHVTLQGSVTWSFQRDEAARAVQFLAGISHITNAITLAPRNPPRVTDLEARVGDAIARLADLDARSIRITEIGGRVQLHGHVHSLSEKRTAGRSAASAPGITEVDNEIVVIPA
jgi:osmotically-inducible protein OsmY